MKEDSDWIKNKQDLKDSWISEGGKVGQAGRDTYQLDNSSIIFQTRNFFVSIFPGIFSGDVEIQDRMRKSFAIRSKNFVRQYIEASLESRSRIELGLTERLDLNKRPWDFEYQSSLYLKKKLTSSETISQLFELYNEGESLLVVGKPGSGKTISLLDLALNLLDKFESQASLKIPLFLNLSFWPSKSISIERWLILELNRQYFIPEKIAKRWIIEENLVIILDGLDEVKKNHQNDCAYAINAFIRSYPCTSLVISSRIDDYTELEEKLYVQHSLSIRPIPSWRVFRYLEACGEPLNGVLEAVKEDAILKTMAKTPLILSIIILAYKDFGKDDLLSISELSKREHLFETYIDRMLSRSKSDLANYDKKLATKWLSFLARKLQDKSLPIFYIESINASWLDNKRQKLNYQIYLLFACVAPMIIAGAYFGVVYLNVYALSAAYVYDEASEQQVINILPYNAAKQSILTMPRLSTLIGGAIGLVFWNYVGFTIVGKTPSFSSLFLIFLSSLTIGSAIVLFVHTLTVIFSRFIGWLFIAPSKKDIPNQLTWLALKNSVFLSTFVSFSAGLAYFLLTFLLTDLPFRFLNLAFLSLGYLIGIGFLSPFGAFCTRHWVLRKVLSEFGSMPKNYSGFLDWCCNRLLLGRVNGGYFFVHRMLMEHIALKYTTK
ncbi:NACHT domain-containing protein [Phormidium tenue]|uniref:NACHT domain-containing protein n=1 Tax=Phormidium tenue NIES-30 TaxID=549789 RepID=A0A1U7J754_9CYAN|nr:NACHT domain-containing protein [Phormidium tenue]MBD2232319.1 NACHT domain-containing protein [Phormidium tenue FACHB-1052]OKH48749.1 hypothetical protein NIES30_09440 [Phormidium tenue NIES-30]